MKIQFSILILAGAVLAAEAAGANATSRCKCVPTDPCWPSDSDFQTLNQSVAGNLIRGVPPGSVCYKDQPNYNETACKYVLDNWLVSTFHAENPISVGWPQFAGNPCPPIYPNGTSVNGDVDAGAKGCELGGYPVYALNATNVTHIQEVVRFTRDHNIRLNVKSTGHNFQGRSTAYGSISIWTHYLQGTQYYENFQAESCPSNTTQMAFSIAAGDRVRDVYEAANKQNAIVVAGSAQDVGIVGWFTGGGHGPLSSTYGMGVDNVLQVTMITPQGDLVTANECLHPDLLWAVRGGGGGTFGVITEVVMKAYPSPTMESQSFDIQLKDPNNLTAFFDAVVFFWSELPRLKEGGLSGYSELYGPIVSPTNSWGFGGSYAVFGQPNGTAESLFTPINQYFAPLSETLNYTSSTTYSPSFFASWNFTIGYEPVGGINGVMSSRLLPAHALLSDPSHLRSTIQNLSLTTQNILFYPVANSQNRNLNVSLNLAWRDAVTHNIVVTSFPDNFTYPEQAAAYEYGTDVIAPQLKSLAPDSGAYLNEGDPNDPDWQYTFFGENYPRLRAVKERYDPDGVLWCRACVGSEDWVPHEKYGDEDGQGRLCKADWVV